MVEGVPFLWPVFREEAVAQGVIAHHVLDLQGSRPGDLSPSVQVFLSLCIHSANVTRHRRHPGSHEEPHRLGEGPGTSVSELKGPYRVSGRSPASLPEARRPTSIPDKWDGAST